MINTSLYDSILKHKSSNKYIIANTYLHILNAHPEFIEQYNLSAKEKIWQAIRFRLVTIVRVFQTIFDKKYYSTEKKKY